MNNWEKLVAHVKDKLVERKRIQKEDKRKYEFEQAELKQRAEDARKEREAKYWGDQEPFCPKCGSELELKKWESYNSDYHLIGPNNWHGSHLYRVYYAQCKNSKCHWQKRTYEEWSGE